jgi:hypothetical protein
MLLTNDGIGALIWIELAALCDTFSEIFKLRCSMGSVEIVYLVYRNIAYGKSGLVL